MRLHHTKNKGDLGVLYAAFDLAEKGFEVLRPLSEHTAYDLVATREGRFYRVQVKYRAAKDGVIAVPFKTCWADRHGVHTQPVDKDDVDVYCVYCPDTRRCYYLDPKKFELTVQLRLIPTRNGVKQGVHFAEDFVSFPEFT